MSTVYYHSVPVGILAGIIAESWQQWIREERVDHCGGPGSPRNTDKGEDRVIIRVIMSAEKTPLTSILRHIPPFRYQVVSGKTIRI